MRAIKKLLKKKKKYTIYHLKGTYLDSCWSGPCAPRVGGASPHSPSCRRVPYRPRHSGSSLVSHSAWGTRSHGAHCSDPTGY